MRPAAIARALKTAAAATHATTVPAVVVNIDQIVLPPPDTAGCRGASPSGRYCSGVPGSIDPRQNTAATSFANASARWLIACFSAGSSSAKVRVSPSGTNTGS